eukprot:COSAG06_NODE_5440_length_3481_cov_3.278533_3_plen_21_part_01
MRQCEWQGCQARAVYGAHVDS